MSYLFALLSDNKNLNMLCTCNIRFKHVYQYIKNNSNWMLVTCAILMDAIDYL